MISKRAGNKDKKGESNTQTKVMRALDGYRGRVYKGIVMYLAKMKQVHSVVQTG